MTVGTGIHLLACTTPSTSAVEVTWWSCQQIVAAHADLNRARGMALLAGVIDRLRTGLPAHRPWRADDDTISGLGRRRGPGAPVTMSIAPRRVRNPRLTGFG